MTNKGLIKRINHLAREGERIIVDNTTRIVYQRNFDWEAGLGTNLYDKAGVLTQRQINSGQLCSRILLKPDFGKHATDKWEPCVCLQDQLGVYSGGN